MVSRRAQVVLGLAVLARVCVRRDVGGPVLSEDRAPSGRDVSRPRKGDRAQQSRAQAWRNSAGDRRERRRCHVVRAEPVVEVFTTRARASETPTTVDGVRVHAVVTGMIVARSATLRYPRPVPIGVSTGLADAATGTLGARVTNGANVYALSNNHVFAGVNAASIGDHILQPGPIEDGGIDPDDLIATLADYQPIDFSGGTNTMDAAIALTHNRRRRHSDPAGRLRVAELDDGSRICRACRCRSTGARPDSRRDRSTRSTSTSTSATSR